jgi:hypothetical protein
MINALGLKDDIFPITFMLSEATKIKWQSSSKAKATAPIIYLFAL